MKVALEAPQLLLLRPSDLEVSRNSTQIQPDNWAPEPAQGWERFHVWVSKSRLTPLTAGAWDLPPANWGAVLVLLGSVPSTYILHLCHLWMVWLLAGCWSKSWELAFQRCPGLSVTCCSVTEGTRGTKAFWDLPEKLSFLKEWLWVI